ADAPGFAAGSAERQDVRDLAARLFDGPHARGRRVADGPAAVGEALAAALAPDLTLAPATSDVGFVHRRLPAADLYFVANTGNVARHAVGSFHAAHRHGEWWDPMTGRVRPAVTRAAGGGSMEV